METNQTAQQSVEHNENPYVAVVSRKVRNLKKKYDRVVLLDTQKKEGKKALNEEQLVLVDSKPSLEKALAELESLKKQLEDVAEQEKVKSVVTTPATVREAAPQTETMDSSTGTQSVELVANSTQYEQEAEPTNVASNTEVSDVLRAQLHKLLKLFHICSRYTSLSGNSLPADINYFGKCLLGETSIDCFSKTLNQSVRNAELYLDDVLGSQYEAIRGMSYSQISDIIDSLMDQLPVPSSPQAPRAPTPPPQSPQINFFADGGLNEASDARHLQEHYNPPLGSFGTSSSPFPLPPSAVVMYDQWNSAEASPPVSPSTLAASALGGVIGSSTVASSSENVTEDTPTPAAENPESGTGHSDKAQSKKGRGHFRDRSKGRGRGRGKESSVQGDNGAKPEIVAVTGEHLEAAENKKGVSWGGQEKKAGGALAAVGGIVDSTPNSDKEPSGKVSGSGRTRGRGSGGRGPGRGRTSENSQSEGAAAKDVNASESGRGTGRGRGTRGRGSGRANSRGEGGRGNKTQSPSVPSTA